MVDRVSLEVMGFIFGGVTALVVAIGALVVHYQVGAKVSLDQTAIQTGSVLPVSLTTRR